MDKDKTTKAWCIVNKRTGKIAVTNYGTNDNPVFDVYPTTKSGEKNALGSFNGNEEVRECEIIINPKRHECNCEFCKRIHWAKRNND